MYRVFSGHSQPTRYIVDDLYEPERDDYEEMLGGKSREAIEPIDFGYISMSPLIHLNAAGTAYLLPRLIEISESGKKDKQGDPFLIRFIIFVSIGPSADQFSQLNRAQRHCIAKYLEHIKSIHLDLVKRECWDDVLEEALESWRGE